MAGFVASPLMVAARPTREIGSRRLSCPRARPRQSPWTNLRASAPGNFAHSDSPVPSGGGSGSSSSGSSGSGANGQAEGQLQTTPTSSPPPPPPPTHPPQPALRVLRATTEQDKEPVYHFWQQHLGWDRDDRDDEHGTEIVLATYIPNGGPLVGAGRLARTGQNVQIGRVFVLEDCRGHGVGRKIVEKLIEVAAPIRGALYVEATREELGFYSILGFETQGNEYLKNNLVFRHMVYRVPMCAPSTDCVGLHHTAVRVLDIERSLAFYGIIGFVVSEKFCTPAGERACFVEGLGVRLQLVESTTGAGVADVQYWPGFLTFDVTKIAISLDTWLDHLQRRNGGILTITAQPANQVIGSSVFSIATIEDPDGLPIDFIRREGQIPVALTPKVNW